MSRLFARIRASKLSHALAALLAALAAVGVTIAVSDQGVIVHVGKTHVVTTTATVPEVVVADPNQQLSPAQAKDDAKHDTSSVGLGLHEDQRDETPPGVPAQELAQGQAMTDSLAAQTLVTPEQPAGAQNYRCYQHPVVNYSSLTHRIIGVALHFTVSPPGSHVGVWSLFNTPSFGASSTFLWEPLTNLCWQLVSLEKKSWAQLSANSYYWSIEIVTNDLSRAGWLATPMIKEGKLAALVADLLKKAGAPPRLVDPQGCVFLAGVTDHSRLECGNTHWDVGPGFPWDVFMKQVRDHYNGAAYKPVKITAKDQDRCARVRRFRTHPNRPGNSRTAFERRLKTTQVRGLKCVDGKARHA